MSISDNDSLCVSSDDKVRIVSNHDDLAPTLTTFQFVNDRLIDGPAIQVILWLTK
jgi:hypothetical protein